MLVSIVFLFTQQTLQNLKNSKRFLVIQLKIQRVFKNHFVPFSIDPRPGQTADTRYRQKVVLVTHGAFHQCHHWRPLEGDRRCHQQGLRPEGPSPEGSRPGPPPRLCPEERHGCVSRPSALRPGRRTPPAQRNRKRTSKYQHTPSLKCSLD